MKRLQIQYPRGSKARTYRVARKHESVVPRFSRVTTFCRPQTFEAQMGDGSTRKMTTTGQIRTAHYDQRRSRKRRTDEDMLQLAYVKHAAWLGEKPVPKARRPRPPVRSAGSKSVRRVKRGRVDRKGERFEYAPRPGRRRKNKTRAKRYQ